MADILIFKPKHQKDCEANLADFIAFSRDQLTVFDTPHDKLDWDAIGWKGVCNFTRAGAPSRGFKPEDHLSGEILPFAKAYMRYSQGVNPTKLKNEIKALRAIEPALLQVYGKADVTLVDHIVLDEAAAFARANFAKTAYQAGTQLRVLAEFLYEKKIIPGDLNWHHGIGKPKEGNRTGKQAQKAREEKMPSEEALNALAELFANNPYEPSDKVALATVALLMCAPSRISEIHALPLDCLRYEKDDKGIKQTGLRFFARKGYGHSIKWVPTEMRDIAPKAVSRVKELSEQGRWIAKWLEERPDEFPRHPKCPTVLEDIALTDRQICDALDLSFGSRSTIWNFFKVGDKAPKSLIRLSEKYKAKADEGMLTLRMLNHYCRYRWLPETFPFIDEDSGVKYSEALFCFRANEFNSAASTKPPRPWRIFSPNNNWLTDRISNTDHQSENSKTQKTSIFKRYGYRNADGSDIEMTSHQFRHYLDTLVARGGLGQLDIARWSGRANIHQNESYIHLTDDDYQDMAKQVGVGEENKLIAKVRAHTPVTFEDLEAIGNATAHVTLIGFCVHDYSMSPCLKHLDCINCSDTRCVKGDDEKLKRLRELRDKVNIQLRNAQAAVDESIFGADRWSQTHLTSLSRANQLIELLESPDIEDGAVIRLNIDSEHSAVKRALAAQNTPVLPAPEVAAPPGDVEELLNLLEF